MDELSIGGDVTMRAGAPSALGRIDQYELVRELGGGGFGCVYLAKDTVAGIEVAVKGLPPEVKHNKEELENIRENFALVSRLHHPNIAAALVLHPVVKAEYASRDPMEKLRVFEGDTLMVMEYAPGSTLSSWRKQFPGRRVPFDMAVDVVRQIASALDYAHERKIIHRDIKPANVMIEPLEGGGNAVRILDFGLAAEIRSSMGRVSREIRDMSGTRPYMAPEQWAGEKQGAATDQYALAVLFCELVSGEVPYQSAFESGDSIVMMANVIHQSVKLPGGVPEKARTPLLRALSKKPSGRYPTCEAFAEALGRRVALPWHLLVIGLLMLAVCAAAGWRLWHGKALSPVTVVDESATASADEPVTADVEPVSVANAEPKVEGVPSDPAKGVVSSEEPRAVQQKSEPPQVVRTPPPPPARPVVYAISYDLNGGVNAQGNPLTFTTNDLPIRLAPPTREGYKFVRWSPSAEVGIGTRENRSFCALWEKVDVVRSPSAAVPVPKPVPKDKVKAAPPEFPTLWIVARVEGKEVFGAKMKAMDGERELPCKWNRRLFRGRSLGPYDVTYSDGKTDYHGTFRILSVDWNGTKTNVVDLVRGKLAPKYKGTGRWF